VLTPARLAEAVERFLVSRTVAGRCTSRTVQLYREVLAAFVKGVPCTTWAIALGRATSAALPQESSPAQLNIVDLVIDCC